MATVTDSSIMSMAQEIVTDFLDGKTSLNEGVSKKASASGLNTDQTQRLIERTNTEAFLRQFPEKSDFEVASPEVVLGEKVAKVSVTKVAKDSASDEGLFKAASEQKNNTMSPKEERWNKKLASISEEDLFGIDDNFKKLASETALPNAIDIESREMLKCLANMNKTASEIVRENTAKEILFGERLEEFAEFVKQASLSDRQSIESSERELLEAFPDDYDLIRNVYNEIVNNMEEEHIAPVKLARAIDTTPKTFYKETELTNKFEKVLEVMKGV